MRVAITRPKERSRATRRLVEERGWEAIIVPGVEILQRPTHEITAGVGDIRDYHWVVITSAAGVDIMVDLFGAELKKLKVAVVGSKTGKALEEKGIKVALVPRRFRAENLAEELKEQGIKGKRILIARASSGREVLVRELEKEALVREVQLYDTVVPRDKGPMREFLKELQDGRIDAVIFTSGQTVENFFSVLGEGLAQALNRVKVCAIAPVTKKALEKRGVKGVMMPETYTIDACLDLLE
jgi:uroporphyrinogen III methyltransferase/synthase